MIGIDTNVLLRFLVDDDVEQNESARRFMAERTEDDPVYLSAVVLAETVWVLRRRLGYSQRQITEMLRRLLGSVEAVIEFAEELEVELLEPDATISDLADCLVAWAALKAGCHAVLLRPFAPNLLAARLGRLSREIPTTPNALRGLAALQLVGTNRVWPDTQCPTCHAGGAVSFEFSSYRRMWYACLGCDHVWLGPRQE